MLFPISTSHAPSSFGMCGQSLSSRPMWLQLSANLFSAQAQLGWQVAFPLAQLMESKSTTPKETANSYDRRRRQPMRRRLPRPVERQRPSCCSARPPLPR